MTSLGALARGVQGVAASGAAAAQAGAVSGALQKGTKGALKSVGKLAGRGGKEPEIPADGSRCQACGLGFGILRRRHTCASCDRFLCASCLGATAGISCLCSSVCPQCRQQTAQLSTFESCRAAMEEGVHVTIGLPPKSKKKGLFGSGGAPRKLIVWLSLDRDVGELHWGTLEQRGGRPAEEDRVLAWDVHFVRDTGAALELSIKGQAEPTTLEFSTAEDRAAWKGHLELAADVLAPEAERKALNAARATHRQREIEERRALNDERRKKLSENLGMRFTAEAMAARSSDAKRGG